MKNLVKNLKPIWWQTKLSVAKMRYTDPASKLKIIGVTGTNGKTTTATLLYKIATELGYKAGLVSTVENIIGKEKISAIHTTPDSVSLIKLFAKMVSKDCEYVFMEVSSHALDQKRVAGIQFAGGIFSNLTHDHLDYHKSLENYFLAKKKLFQMLPSNAFALSNTDDGHGKLMLENIKASTHTYGFSGGENFHGEIFKLDFSGLELRFNNENIKSKLLGKFNAYNLLAVWSASKLLGFDMEKVGKILEDITPPTGRFQYFTSPNSIICIVDYAHTPDALENVLLTAREIKGEKSRIISVFGCGGDRDPLKRRVMGKVGAELSDIAIFTSDNPRSENPVKIIEEMKTDLSMDLTKKVMINPDRREAIKEAINIAHSGDIVLVAGKGHETYQDIKGTKHHFDDMEELKEIFK